VKAVRAPDVLKQLETQGSIPVASPPEAFRKRIAGVLARWKSIIQERGIKAGDG
jgi:tripartite-type tricarboxylate transporter receptor subunit TctC